MEDARKSRAYGGRARDGLAECCPLAMRLDGLWRLLAWTLDRELNGSHAARRGQRGNNQPRPDVSPTSRRHLQRTRDGDSPTPHQLAQAHPLSAIGLPGRWLAAPNPTRLPLAEAHQELSKKAPVDVEFPPIPKKSGEHREKALNPTSAHRSLSSLRANRNHGCSRHSDVSLSPNNCHDALVVAGGICVWAGRSPSPANTTTAGVDSSNLGWSRTGTDRPFPPAPSAESSSPTVSSMPS